MRSLFIAGLGKAPGKTALCAALGRTFQEAGKRVSYLKPLSVTTAPEQSAPGGLDAPFIRRALGLDEASCRCLISLPSPEAAAFQLHDHLEAIARAHQDQNADVVLVEGPEDAEPSERHLELSRQIAETLGSEIILLARYHTALSAERLATAARLLNGRLLGVVLNAAPATKSFQDTWRSALSASGGTPCLGILPLNRRLMGLSVAELARTVEGKIITVPEAADAVVENFVVGSMSVDPGPDYFNRLPNKAVITRMNRPDQQGAALETSPLALVMTGGGSPLIYIDYRAREKNIPTIAVQGDTLWALERIEESFDRTRLHSLDKLAWFQELLKQHFDFEVLGLT
ncbi:MAG: phosphotransacetylase family protein [Chloroflexi bacterium]|nr:phosphotransacetylase family protein [Chloroflexota bacterium]